MKLKDFFSGRAGQERRLRDGYPEALIQLLETRFGLNPEQMGADVGAESGKLAELFLEHKYMMAAVEHHADKGTACERLCAQWPRFRIVEGTPDATGLPDASVDFVVSARALYWPDREEVTREFRRILRPRGLVVLITDNRVYSGGSQSEAFDEILRTHCKEYRERRQPYDIAAAVAGFFGASEVYEDAFVGHQTLTEETLIEQASDLPIYPSPGDPQRKAIESALRVFFADWAVDGELIVPKICRIACARLNS